MNSEENYRRRSRPSTTPDNSPESAAPRDDDYVPQRRPARQGQPRRPAPPARRAASSARAGSRPRPSARKSSPLRRPAAAGEDFNPFRSNFVARRDLLAPVIGIVLILVVAIALSLTGFSAEGKSALSELDISDLKAGSPIRISEVASSNAGSFASPWGEFCDWIELENVSGSAQSLSGLMLADELAADKLYPLPNVVLEPGECALVYATGAGISEAGQPLQAPFRLSSAGETLYLITDTHELYDYVELPALDADTSYACDLQSGEWSVTADITPGVDNASFYAAPSLALASDSPIVISEAQPSNRATLLDADGDASDWIEVYNGGDTAVSLSGWGLSDSTARPLKWTFPDVTLEPGEYMVVFASGKNRRSGELHTSFALSSDGGAALLADPQGGIVSLLNYGEARTDASYAPSGSGAEELLVPTPGSANTSEAALNALKARIQANPTGVMIQEVLCSNSVDTTENPNGSDYIELYNAGGSAVDLSGMGLSDNPRNPRKWQFPEGASLGSGEYLVVYCNGTGEKTSTGYYDTSFRLSSAGCTVTLSLPDGTIVDECAMGRQYSDIAYGRTAEGGFAYMEATPGTANSALSYAGRVDDVRMSVSGGLMSEAISLELASSEGAAIYYTTDCSTPTTSSTLYTGPIAISSTTVVRAAAFRDGYLSSYVTTQSYFYGLDHQLPVVSLVSDDKYLFDWNTGLLVMGPNAFEEEPYGRNGKGANFWMGWEYPANVEYFDESGASQASERIGIKIIGQDSRAQEQKGIAMYARSKYGNTALNFNPFEQLDFTSYRALTLRPSGEDAPYTHLRDATLTSLAAGTNAMYQAAAPCVLYINGQCWGVYNLRERINKYYVAQHEGITDSATIDNIDLIKGDTNTLNGSISDYKELLAFVSDNSLKDEDNLRYLTDRIDLDNYLDYVLCEILVGNTDSGNIKYYQSPEAGVKWKWIFFDLDWAMYTMDINYFQRYLNSTGHGVRSVFDNSLIRALLQNDSVRDRFLRRMAELMQGSFAPQNILDTIEAYKSRIYYDMQYQFAKWGGSYERWERYVGKLESNVGLYAANALSGVKEFFDLSSAEMTEYFGQITFD